MARAIGEAHRRYTVHINKREGWTGYLWQGRFGSCVMDNPHCLAAARYVEMNPVNAGLAEQPGEYAYSSARAHLSGRDDVLVSVAPLSGEVEDWRKFLNSGMPEEQVAQIEKHSRTGRPLGAPFFMERMGRELNRALMPKKLGRPKRQK